jgi:4-hydroxy-3-polyprenylbenzoate decarboxylase
MAFKDNRQFIETLEQTEDVVRVKQEVDWDLEVGAIVRRLCETNGPAALFEKIKDYPDGYRILGGSLATYRRLSIALGLPADTSFADILKVYANRLSHPVKPKIMESAPCKENVILGKDVDLFRLPAPMIHEGDGGRYIGTWHLLVTEDPDSEWINWGMYRFMVYDRQYLPMGKAMPFAVVIGADPVCSLIAASALERGQSEVDYAGALREEPVELVKCETNDLLVPAHAEIVLEGDIMPNAMVEEGPFGEFTGYSATPRMPRTVHKVKAITHRNDPILTMTSIGFPVDEDHIIMSVAESHHYFSLLKERGMPVTGVFVPPQTAGILAIVGIKPAYSNIAAQVAKVLTFLRLPDHIIVVDDETDIYNLEEVLHAFATKCHPVRGIRVFNNDVGLPLVPYYSYEEKISAKGAKAVFDCTFPAEWPKTETPRKMVFDKAYPKEIKDKILANWNSYGFE